MARELPQGQIVPVARPVESFLQPVQRQVAAPAAPQMMPNPSGIRVLGQGSGGSIAGSNQFAELATALAPFSSGLLKLADAGLEMYASNEYQRGVNEAMRGQVLANQQIQRSGAEYAAETRKLERTDPQGAVLMDRVNPYRQAGRVNALSRLAAAEAESVMLDEYRNLPDAALLQPGDSKLAEIKGRAIQRLSEKYRLDPSTPGFVDYVLPQLGQGGDKVTAQHWEDRQKYLKATVPRTAASEMLSIYATAMAADNRKGRIEWTEYDQATGQPVQRVATLAEPEAFEEGLRLRFEQITNGMANEAGLQGEAANFQQQALMQVAEMAADNEHLRRIVGLVGVGPPDKDGKRAPAVLMFGSELLDIKDKADDRTWKQRQRGEEMGLDAFDRQAARIAYEMEDGPEKSAAMNELIGDFSEGIYERNPDGTPKTKGMPLNPADLGERAVKTYKTGDDLVARTYNNEPAEEWIQEVQTRVGSAWNAREADKELDAILRTAKPEDRDDLRRQYAAIRQRKEGEKDDAPSALIDPLIGAWMKANLRRMYPSNTTEAALRGANITDMLAFGDANVAASAQRQLSSGRRLVYDRLAEAAAKKGAKLSAAEITAVTQKALADFGTTDKRAYNYNFPGSSTGEPSVGGAPARPPVAGDEQPKPPPGRQAFTERVYPAGQLDNIPNRGQRLKQGAPVLDLTSAQREVTRVMNGDAPSAPVSRAAKDAGMSVGKFLLRQLDAYPSFKLPPDARNQLLRSSRGAEAIGSRVASRGGQRPIDVAANWFLNTITGTRPAAAGTMAMFRVRSGGGRDGSNPFMGNAALPGVRPFVGVLALLRSGEGGWDSANRGSAGDTRGGIPGLSRKTLGQWKQLQASGYFALGAYQFIPRTLALAAREAGLPDSTVMTPAVQDRLAVQLMIGSKRPRLADYLRGKNNNLEAAADDLALEWASVATRSGGTAYPGVGNNAASIGRDKAMRVLKQARAMFLGGGGAAGLGSAGGAAGSWQSARSFQTTSSFGNKESFRRSAHEGADIPIPSGAQLAFRMGGQVIDMQRTTSTDREANGGYGSYVDVRLDNGQVVRMAHLGQIPRGLRKGSRFRANQSIALAGGRPGAPGAGRSGGAHVHLEELSGAMGTGQTLRGKRDPERQGGALDHLMWRVNK
jgi:murein DD-endopeptidase MepM/ murein hydrolase activator NlpD